ncbi:hypothetical protein [Balneicella halophila]|nr:hypothetical protein [Balneicella halophila]
MKWTSKTLHFGLSLLFCLVSVTLYAKDGIQIYGTYKVNGGETNGVQIRLLRNGIKESSNVTGNGKFQYDLKFNNQYELSFSKSGYITKKVVISTDVPERVLESNSDFPPFKIEVELFRRVEGGDYSIFDEPVAMVIYDKELDDFDFDRAYNAEIEEEIKAVEADIVRAPVKPKVDKSSLQYEALIKKADKEFDVKSYNAARKTYDQALYIKPAEEYPKIRIELIDKILADLAKREKQKEQNVAYYALIDKADVLFDEKKYSQARSYYVEATEIKPDQQHPKDRIKLIDQIIADRDAEQRKYDNAVDLGDKYFQEKKYKPARNSYEEAIAMREDEPYPKEQIKRIERLLSDLESEKEKNDNYNNFIEAADNLFHKKNWTDARMTYEKASDIFPDKRYPKEKIKAIDKLLKSQEKELSQYNEAITKADTQFERENWDKAQEFYEDALSIKPLETYPKEQIKKIEDKLALLAEQKAKDTAYTNALAKGDRAYRTEDWEKAKEAYFDALKVKPEEIYPKDRLEIVEERLAALREKQEEENRYNEKLKQADLHYDQKQWNEAIANYRVASEMRPSENYPKAQIKKIEHFLKEKLERQTAQEKEDKYNGLIADGDVAFKSESWDNALANYEGALQIKPEGTYPKSQIRKINDRIKEIEKEQEKQKAYDVALAEADNLYGRSEWLPAIAMYDKALDIKPNESYPKTQIELIRGKISAEELAREEARKAKEQALKRKVYDEAIAQGDKEFGGERYSFAKVHYRKALTILPREQYPKDKLDKIDELVKQKQEENNQYYKKAVVTDTVEKQFYKVLEVNKLQEVKYYKRIEPKYEKEQRYVKNIDATKPDEIKYDKLMLKAQKEESAGNIPFAKAYYRQAYIVKPSLELFTKLKELDIITSGNLIEIEE